MPVFNYLGTKIIIFNKKEKLEIKIPNKLYDNDYLVKYFLQLNLPILTSYFNLNDKFKNVNNFLNFKEKEIEIVDNEEEGYNEYHCYYYELSI